MWFDSNALRNFSFSPLKCKKAVWLKKKKEEGCAVVEVITVRNFRLGNFSPFGCVKISDLMLTKESKP